jgi:hypothetical protein
VYPAPVEGSSWSGHIPNILAANRRWSSTSLTARWHHLLRDGAKQVLARAIFHRDRHSITKLQIGGYSLITIKNFQHAALGDAG